MGFSGLNKKESTGFPPESTATEALQRKGPGAQVLAATQHVPAGPLSDPQDSELFQSLWSGLTTPQDHYH